MAAPRRHRLVVLTGLAVLVVDQLTKIWALDALSGGRMIEVVGSLRFNLAFNSGAAFSAGSGRNLGPFIAIAAVAVVGILTLTGSSTRSVAGALSVGAIAGGAFGNLVDRALRDGSGGVMGGHVIDFIDLRWWPVFNVADMAVVAGAIGLVLFGLRPPEPAVADGLAGRAPSADGDRSDGDRSDGDRSDGPPVQAPPGS